MMSANDAVLMLFFYALWRCNLRRISGAREAIIEPVENAQRSCDRLFQRFYSCYYKPKDAAGFGQRRVNVRPLTIPTWGCIKL